MQAASACRAARALRRWRPYVRPGERRRPRRPRLPVFACTPEQSPAHDRSDRRPRHQRLGRRARNRGHARRLGTRDASINPAATEFAHEALRDPLDLLALGGDEGLLARKQSGNDPRLDIRLEDNALARWTRSSTSRPIDRSHDLYSPDAHVRFDIDTYRPLIGRWSATGGPLPGVEADPGRPVRRLPACRLQYAGGRT